MKAAVIDSLERGPRFADFAEPVVADGETLIEVTAAGLHPIVRMLASGEHYGSQGTLPMVPGIDGTGRSPDGTRVYFGGVRPPYGPMAQRAAAPFVLPLPDGLDEVTAAAVVNPGNGAWLALTRRAALQPGETVLVLGATGVSGRIAVALAARMGGPGDRRRPNRAILTSSARPPPSRSAAPTTPPPWPTRPARTEYTSSSTTSGPPHPGRHRGDHRRGMAHAAPRVRLVEVGQMARPTISLPADVLRSSGLEILGSGPGTSPLLRSSARFPSSWPSQPPATCRSTSTRCPSPRSSRPGSAAAAACGPSSGPDHEPACGVQNGRIWTALISIRIQPETTQIAGLSRSS